ncbi:NAD(P)/FAD-dependent oxidoreductase [Ureaplasma ceti]|uniref:Ferredoxin--NADP reductase n=1 Tax=Ureaplasma ceti TaxID=3119530 RepID=A0ABP9U8H1_9BACT
MENVKIYDVIVIGGGPVGLYATFIAGYLKLNCLCIEADEILGGQPNKVYPSKFIYDFPGYEKITGSELTQILEKQARQYSQYTSIQTGIKIVSYEIDEEGTIILIDDKLNHYFTKNVILTVGIGAFEPMKLEQFADSLTCEKVKYCLEPDHTYDNKKILILGGGDAAVDYAKHIQEKTNSLSVTLAHRRDKLRADGLTVEDLQQAGVKVLMPATLTGWTTNSCQFSFPDGSETQIEYDLLLVQYGLKNLGSNIHSWASFNKLANKFVVDEHFETNIKRFYAAGNCVSRPNRINMIIMGISEVNLIINRIRSEIPHEGRVGW